MATTRLIRAGDNRTTSASAVIMNGGSGPPLIQDPAYPMSNLLNNDRNSVWASGPTATDPIVVHIDMGLSQNVRIFGLLGMRAATGGFGPVQLTLGFRTALQGYASDPASYTIAGSVFVTGPDVFLEITPTGMRYLQFSLASPGSWGNGFSLGKFLAAATVNDLDMIYSPGSARGVVVPQIRREAQSGTIHVTRTGLNYQTFALSFRSITDATVGILNGIAISEFPFVYLDYNNAIFECLLSRADWQRTHRWSPPNLWDADLEFRQLA